LLLVAAANQSSGLLLVAAPVQSWLTMAHRFFNSLNIQNSLTTADIQLKLTAAADDSNYSEHSE
jgi:hypothetical protein